MPNYSILVDTRDRLTPQVTYVPEENLEGIIEVVGWFLVLNTTFNTISVISWRQFYCGKNHRPVRKSLTNFIT